MPNDSPAANLRIKRITSSDAAGATPALRTLRSLIVECRTMYPGIEDWFDRKVIPGVERQDRAAFVAYVGDRPIASAVVKAQGANAKFCHLRVADDLQDLNVGALFFSIMALESRQAKSIHFTLPESLWLKREEFFRSFGFEKATPSGTQYRLFDNELCCAARSDAVWGSVLARFQSVASNLTISGHCWAPDLLMSIKPPYAAAVLEGRKRVEVRRRFSTRWVGSRVAFYATAPESALVGDAVIEGVTIGDVEDLWRDFGLLMGCTKEELVAYAGSGKVAAILLGDVRPYRAPLMRTQLERLTRKDLRPPQSFCSTDTDDGWARALYVAALLHATAAPSKSPTPVDQV